MVATAHYLDETALAHGEGDEVWECDDTDVESCSDAESDAEATLPLPPSPAAAQVRQVLEDKHPQTAVHKPAMMAPLPAVKVRTVQTSLQSQAQTSSPWGKGATELALHLRRDNERLRELLVEAQRQAEEAMEQGESKSNVDFAHLLELVKEFGTGIDDCGEMEQRDDAQMCMSFNTQEFRMDDEDVDEKDTEIKQLQSELAELKKELKAQQAGAKPLSMHVNEEKSTELLGYWVSSKTGELHHVVRADTDTDLDAPNATEWEIVEVDEESVTLQSDYGVEHTVERLKTRMFGESLLWGSGDLWTVQSKV